MKNLGQLLQQLATKAGIDLNDANLKTLLSNAELTKITIPGELVTALDNSLLSLEQAMDNHPDVKKKYHAQALNALDKKIDAVMETAGLADDKATEIKDEKNSYKRFDMLVAAINETASEKVKAAGKATPEDKSLLQKQVDDLLKQVKDLGATHATALKAEQDGRKADKRAFKLQAMLGGIKTIYDDLPVDAKITALEALINKGLQSKGAVLDFDAAGELTLLGEGDTAVVGANNVKYTPQTFIDEVLAQNKVLKVSDPKNPGNNNPQNPQNPQQQQRQTVIQGTPAPSGNNQATANMARQLREKLTPAK